jgi:hypothetical protein
MHRFRQYLNQSNRMLLSLKTEEGTLTTAVVCSLSKLLKSKYRNTNNIDKQLDAK